MLSPDVYAVMRETENEGRVFDPRARYLKVTDPPGDTLAVLLS